MKAALYIFLGGGLGSVLRYFVSYYISRRLVVGAFPLGTFLVNLAGCFLIGLFAGYFLRNESDLKYLLIAGFCGGFTTFSTFSLENYNLWQQQQYGTLVLYIVISLIVCFLAVTFGFRLSK